MSRLAVCRRSPTIDFVSRWSTLLHVPPLLLASVLVSAGCGARQGTLSTVNASQPGMPCREATRVARGALLRLGYMIEKVELAQPGVTGLVTGRKQAGWMPSSPEAGDSYAAEIRITCSDQGSEFEAVSEAPFGERLEFRKKLPEAIAKIAERRTARPRLKEKAEVGMVIEVEPLRRLRATDELGIDPTVSGVTPVRLRLENRTERAYLFERSKVTLVSQDGNRAQPLSPQQVAAKFRDSIAQTMSDRLIAEGEVAPRGVLTGFLYFPAAAYRRATLLLIDSASEEVEGFSVEF